MTPNASSPKQSKNNYNRSKSQEVQSGDTVLMPREYYDEKHPWFGSQIHYTIDVFRQLIRDARAKKQYSTKDGG